jgi:hypothetical protein
MRPLGVHNPRRRVSALVGRPGANLDPNSIDELLAERDQLARENALLREENEQLSELLQDYGQGLEVTTEVIRDHAVPPPSFETSPSPIPHLHPRFPAAF